MGPNSMASTPALGPFPSTTGSFGGFNQQFGGPPSNYALPTGGLGNAPGAYPPMGQMSSGYGSSSTSHSAASFANPATQAAFTGADHGVPSTSASNGAFYSPEGTTDPFAFLSTGLGGLTVSDDAHSRRNGAGANKSPA